MSSIPSSSSPSISSCSLLTYNAHHSSSPSPLLCLLSFPLFHSIRSFKSPLVLPPTESVSPHLTPIDDVHVLLSHPSLPSVSILNIITGSCRLKCSLASPPVCVSIHRDMGIVAVGTRGGGIVLWSLHSGEMLCRLEGAHYSSVSSLLFCGTDNGYLISGGEDCLIHCWELGELIKRHPPTQGGRGGRQGRGGGGGEGTLSFSSLPKPFHTFSSHSLPVLSLYCPIPSSFSPIFYSISKDKTVKSYDLLSKYCCSSIDLPLSPSSLSVDPNGNHLYVGCTNGTLLKYSLSSASPSSPPSFSSLMGHTSSIHHLSFNSDHSLLLSLSTEALRVWSPLTDNTVNIIRKTGKNHISSVLFLHNRMDTHLTTAMGGGGGWGTGMGMGMGSKTFPIWRKNMGEEKDNTSHLLHIETKGLSIKRKRTEGREGQEKDIQHIQRDASLLSGVCVPSPSSSPLPSVPSLSPLPPPTSASSEELKSSQGRMHEFLVQHLLSST